MTALDRALCAERPCACVRNRIDWVYGYCFSAKAEELHQRCQLISVYTAHTNSDFYVFNLREVGDSSSESPDPGNHE
jgi:hypothetical protein